MTDTTITVIETSDELGQCFDNLVPEIKDLYQMTMGLWLRLSSVDEKKLACAQAIFVGSNILAVVATSDSRFYVQFIKPEVYVAGSSQHSIGLYGAYVNSCSDAVDLAILWLSQPDFPAQLPKVKNHPTYLPTLSRCS